MKKITTLLSKVLNFSLNKAKQSVSVTIVSLLLVSSTSFATPISNLFVFGDSLSDPGALLPLVPPPLPSVCPPPPYSNCRFSNGPVWAELVAAELGVSGGSAYAGGTNYAIGGQLSSELLAGGPFGGQMNAFKAINGLVADPDALYVVWAGGNDFLQGLDPIAAVDNIIATVTALQALGAEDFLIPNLPIANLWAFTFNSALATGLDLLGGGPNLNITQFDVFGTFVEISTNPSDFGFMNVSDPCFDTRDITNITLCNIPDDYLLWDEVHPTAAGHRAIAAAALSALHISAPATLAIFSLGLVALVRTRRKKLA